MLRFFRSRRERDAYWLLDKEGGDEKAFCCFHTTARDVARFGRLMLHRGNWNGKQLVSQAYMDEMLRPASYLKDQWGRDSGFARLLRFADLDYALPWRGNPLHEGDVRAIHLRYTVGRRDCSTLGAQAA